VLTVERIDTLEGLLTLEKDWESLLASSERATPFLTHAWTLAWWRHLGGQCPLRVLVVRDGDRPLLIVPLAQRRSTLYRRGLKLPLKTLEGLSDYHSNRADWIGEPHDEILDALWSHLRTQEKWQVLRLFPLADDSPTRAALERLCSRQGAPSRLTPCHESPFIRLDRSWEERLAQLPRELRRRARRAQRPEHGFRLEIVTKPDQVEETLAEIFEVAERGWAAREGTAISSTPELRGFYTEIAHVAAERGWLFLCLLRKEDRLAAFEYDLLHGATLYNLKVAFDPEFGRFGPGNTLKYILFEYLDKHHPDLLEYDLLGDSASYKSVWSSERRLHWKAHVFNPGSASARLAYGLQGVAERVRAARQRASARSA
jgi:CelD/BcsL family acetyltransferase involved in cellulose biosynthesis